MGAHRMARGRRSERHRNGLRLPPQRATRSGSRYPTSRSRAEPSRAKLAGLDPETTYELRAFSDTDSCDMREFTTEAAPQLPNAGFETWSTDRSDILYPYAADAPLAEQFWGFGQSGSMTLKKLVTTNEKRPASGFGGPILRTAQIAVRRLPRRRQVRRRKPLLRPLRRNEGYRRHREFQPALHLAPRGAARLGEIQPRQDGLHQRQPRGHELRQGRPRRRHHLHGAGALDGRRIRRNGAVARAGPHPRHEDLLRPRRKGRHRLRRGWSSPPASTSGANSPSNSTTRPRTSYPRI